MNGRPKMVRWVLLWSVIFGISCGTITEKERGITEDQPDSLAQKANDADINQLIIKDPDNPLLYFERAKRHFSRKNLDGAMNDVDRALRIDSSNADFYLLKADIYFGTNQSRKSREMLDKCLQLDEENVEAYLKLAEIFLLTEQYGKSIEEINKALKIDVYLDKAYFMKGLNYKYLGDSAKAVSSFQTAVEQNNEYYDAYIQLGLLYGAVHDPIAIAYYDNAIQTRPDNIEAHYNKAIFLQDNGSPAEALTEYGIILKIAPNNYQANFNSGYVNLMHLLDYKTAADNFSKAISLKGSAYDAYYNRGYCYELLNDLPKAESDFRKSLEIKPDYTLAAKGLGRIIDGDYD